jgi:hypothetical protein
LSHTVALFKHVAQVKHGLNESLFGRSLPSSDRCIHLLLGLGWKGRPSCFALGYKSKSYNVASGSFLVELLRPRWKWSTAQRAGLFNS